MPCTTVHRCANVAANGSYFTTLHYHHCTHSVTTSDMLLGYCEQKIKNNPKMSTKQYSHLQIHQRTDRESRTFQQQKQNDGQSIENRVPVQIHTLTVSNRPDHLFIMYMPAIL